MEKSVTYNTFGGRVDCALAAERDRHSSVARLVALVSARISGRRYVLFSFCFLRPYVQYAIEVDTSFSFALVHRRYSEFRRLFRKLRASAPSARLPELPPRRPLRGLTRAVVEHR
eukprot:CAMPEP_0196793208 /NCGR_PEP_ID=MMETSP1104-20130614/32609_1 /TAXON_ID=33652 /ORGANISM="Cafeteria sp., Strain Caron Lab Isolate" /LENGTH=114 /DNA_ID=CAMNT_0042163579 /DNA_START=38 /DNA_END=378 /DNA_ORIENTATION=+